METVRELVRLDGVGHSFEELLDHFFISKNQCGREPGKQEEMIRCRDAAVAQWIVRGECDMVLKTTDPIQPSRQGRADQQPRFVRWLTLPERVEMDETAKSKWKQSFAKVCQCINAKCVAPRRASKRKCPWGTDRVPPREPMKVFSRKSMQVRQPSCTDEAHEGSRKVAMMVRAKEPMSIELLDR